MADPLPLPQPASLNDAKGQTTTHGYRYFDSLDRAARDHESRLGTVEALKTFSIVWFIPAPLAQDYTYINLPYAFTVNSMTTKCTAGTCTAVAKINSTAITGLSNSVSTTEVTNNASGANAFAAGDDIKITLSDVSSSVNVSVTLNVTRP